MTTLVLAVLTMLVVIQCSVVDVLAARLMPSTASHVLISFHVGLTAQLLTVPVMGRSWAYLLMIAFTGLSLWLPSGWGLPGLVLIPLAMALIKFEPLRRKRND